tara:strand:+ start:133 stop:534 length:402 start_codon:yes stop_codon:yes gene_type:complete
MKSQLLKLLLLLSTATFSSLSFGEWVSLGNAQNGTEFYVDFEQMSESKGLVYWTYLQDNLDPDELGMLSQIVYMEGNCANLGINTLSTSIYKQSMARGSEEATITKDNAEITFSASDSMMGYMLQVVCGVYFN